MDTYKQRSFANRYLCALIAPTIVAGIMELTWPAFEQVPVAPFLLAVMFSAWYGGLGPAVMSVIISFLLADYFFIESYFSIGWHGHVHTIRLGMLLAVGVTCGILSELIRKERQRSASSLDAALRAEESQRQSDANYQALFEANPLPMWAYDIETRSILAVNDEAVTHYGYTREEFLAMTIDQVRLSEEARTSRSGLVDPTLQIRTASNICKHRKKNGSPIDVEITHNLLKFAGRSAGLVMANDVTERKRGEDAQCEAEQKYRDIFENALEGIFQSSPDGRFVTVNPALARMFGFDSTEELIRERADISKQHYVDPKRRDEFKVLLEKEGVVHGFEYEAYRKDGTRIWVSDNVREVRDEAGTVLCYEGIAKDITERKRAEEALRESESFRRTIIESEPECVKVVGIDCTLLDMNPAGLAMIGADSLDQVKGQSVLSLIAPEWHDSFLDVHQRVCGGESVVWEFEIIGLNGVRRRMEAHAAPLRNSDSRVIAQLAITRDVTESVRAKESLTIFRNLIDQSNDAIEVLDPLTMHFLDCNTTAHQTLGYTREEFLSLTAFDIDPLIDPSMLLALTADMKPAEFVIFESVHRRKDGSTFPVEINAKNIQLERNYRLAVVRDITERKRAERRTAAFATLAGKLSGAQVPVSAAQIIADTAQELFAWDSCGLQLYDANQQLIHPLLSIDTINGRLTDVTPVDVGSKPTPKARLVIDRGAQLTLRTEPYEFDEDSVPFGDTQRPSASAMSVPICDSAEVIGILSIQSYRANAYDQEALNDLQALADYCGAALNRIGSEEALRRQKEILQKIFDHIPAMISLFDADGRMKLVNREWERWRGWSLKEAQAQNIDLLMQGYPDPAYRQEVLALAANSNGKPFDIKTKVRDGRVLDTTWSISTLSDGTRIGLGQDITERKLTEDALRESEERYRELFENAKDATYVHDLNGRYTSVNRAAEKLSGRSREEIIGRKFSDFVAPEQVDLVSEHLCRKLADEGETIYEVEVIGRNGRIPVEVSSHLIYRDGIAVGVQGTARDITERKRAEEALRQSEREYRGLFENAHDAILIIHPEKEIVLEANQRACEIYGFSRAEFIGMSLETITKNAERGRLRIKETLEQGTSYDFEAIQRRGDGSEMLLNINASVVEYKGQLAIQSINRDVTEQRRAEEALRRSEERFSKAFHSSSAALSISLLEDGRLLEVNGAFLRMTGFSREEVIGRTTVELELFADPSRQAMVDAVRKRGAITNVEFKFQRKSREIRDGLISMELIHLDAGPCILGIAQDVTERNRAEERLREYERVVEGLDEMIVVIGRDFRYLLANRAYLRNRGIEREELLGRPVPEIVGKDAFERVIKEKLEQSFRGQVVSYEMKVTYAAIGEREVSATYFPIEGPAGVDRAACVLRDITERKRDEQALRNYSRRLIEAQESERQNIARELHDQIGQVLTAVQLNLQNVLKSCDSPDSRFLIEEGIAIVDEAVVQVRDLSFELRPALLDDLGLITALRWYADRFAQRTGILATAAFDPPQVPTRLKRELETACFRIVQEALTNVVRHAKASRVLISLKTGGGQILLIVKDDGTGFDVHSQDVTTFTTRVGLRGMKERTMAVGGRLEVRSSPSQGTEIRAQFPYDCAARV